MLLELAGGGPRAAGQLLGFAAGDEVGEDGGDLLEVLVDVGVELGGGQDAVVVEVGVGGEFQLGDLLRLLAGLERSPGLGARCR